MAGRIDTAIVWAARGLAALGAAMVAAIFIIVLAAVVMRYLVSAPFRFTEELSGLLLAMTVFLTLPFTLAAHRSIRVTIVSDRVGGTLRRILWVVGQGVLVAFASVFAYEAYKITEFTVMLNLRTEVSRLDLAPFMVAMTVAVAVAAFIGAWQALRPPPDTGR
ncbi:MAG: TRAP transporter small permease [Pseudomonadota bacterium]